MKTIATFLICVLGTSASAEEWIYNVSKDEFTDAETRIAMSFSPYDRSRYGDTIALFIGCSPSGFYSGVIWEESVVPTYQSMSADVLMRAGENPTITLEADVIGARNEMTYFYDSDSRRVLTELQDAAARSATVILGVETVSDLRLTARFEMNGFHEAAAGVLEFCGE
jgi:hypothetical protein|tara:strand:- start:341 stop:844 length:504 start_codon:yes stop_codon:yes gene_type:complete